MLSRMNPIEAVPAWRGGPGDIQRRAMDATVSPTWRGGPGDIQSKAMATTNWPGGTIGVQSKAMNASPTWRGNIGGIESKSLSGTITLGTAPTTTTPTTTVPTTSTPSTTAPTTTAPTQDSILAFRQNVINQIMAAYDDRAPVDRYVQIMNDASVAAGEGPLPSDDPLLREQIQAYMGNVQIADIGGDIARREYFDYLTNKIGHDMEGFVYPPVSDNKIWIILAIVAGVVVVGFFIWRAANRKKRR